MEFRSYRGEKAVMVFEQQVVVSGGYRTGSTLAYKICLALFDETYGEQNYFRGVHTGQDWPEQSFCYKSHTYLPTDRRCSVVHTIRNPYDILASLKKVKPALPDYVAEVRQIVERDRLFIETPHVLVLPYYSFYGHEYAAILVIQRYLGLRCADPLKLWGELAVWRLKRLTDNPNRESRPGGFVHGHISDDPHPGNFRKHLTKTECEQIKAFLKPGDLGFDTSIDY